MSWGKWFSGQRSDGTADMAKFKVVTENARGNTEHHRLSRTEESGDRHQHDIVVSDTNGNYKEVYPAEVRESRDEPPAQQTDSSSSASSDVET